MNAPYAKAAHDCVNALQRNDQETAADIMQNLTHEHLGTKLFTLLRGLVWPTEPHDYVSRTTQLQQAHSAIDEVATCTA